MNSPENPSRQDFDTPEETPFNAEQEALPTSASAEPSDRSPIEEAVAYLQDKFDKYQPGRQITSYRPTSGPDGQKRWRLYTTGPFEKTLYYDPDAPEGRNFREVDYTDWETKEDFQVELAYMTESDEAYDVTNLNDDGKHSVRVFNARSGRKQINQWVDLRVGSNGRPVDLSFECSCGEKSSCAHKRAVNARVTF